MMKWWRNTAIKWRMFTLLVLCWLIPIAIASVTVSVVVSQRMENQMLETVTTSMNRVVKVIDTEIENCKNESRNATYLGVIAEKYNEYLDSGDAQKLYSDMNMYLAAQYRFNSSSKSVVVFFLDNPDLIYSTYSSATSYSDIEKFRQDCLVDVCKLSGEIDTSMYLYRYDNSLYLMRNMVSSSYKPYAMIITGLDLDYLFDNLTSVWGYRDSCVLTDGERLYGDTDADISKLDFSSFNSANVLKNGNSDYYVYYNKNVEGRNLTYIVGLDEEIIRTEQMTGRYTLLIILVSLIPLCFIVIGFFNKTITKPVNRLEKAADEIASENYGYVIEKEGYSKELNHLNKAFNGMSLKLKQQFEQIYLEELAVRDANIKALQSQINPHFINNTLEIINWEARLNGVYKVSGMIEALSTMLNATMNRKKTHTIPLSEEMEYVDAYLYIISERMGKRLVIQKNIDESLLSEKVPRLIAQPIIENAVEHGVTTSGSGTITINIRADGEYMYLEVRNSTPMSKEDEAKVKEILNLSFDETNQKSLSIGISNVNKRLKLMYGDECGLTIYNEDGDTVSLLKFRREGGGNFEE